MKRLSTNKQRLIWFPIPAIVHETFAKKARATKNLAKSDRDSKTVVPTTSRANGSVLHNRNRRVVRMRSRDKLPSKVPHMINRVTMATDPTARPIAFIVWKNC